ncbi:hypothetical protein HTZ77_26520 [Nonomuraea sp. SMC257]|uniref:Uncharacterized protein n=1 Tax=Nonomuraea montanisoli TaxID=2741721 RepID=A0A7Y6IC04_9ACTN|nr:hypothetical protein [Nonomuraea montanisoli]NUW34958.1 hypothetical protein [Nonomuraea montanisoli]
MDRRTRKWFVLTLLGMLALLAAGVLATFTAQEEHCRRGSCSWHGAFASADGRETRDDTIMRDFSFSVVRGDRVPAIDVGDATEV